MISTKSKSYQDKIWLSHYDSLLDFRKTTGKDYPSLSDNVPKLYHWCKNQRRFYKNNQLSDERKALLDKINFRWDTLHYSFEQRIKQLLAYKKEHGTLHVSQVKYEKSSEIHKLSRWVNEIRRMYNENRLSMERIETLNKIGFIWNMEDERFATNLDKLKRFHKKYGHFDVPQTGRTKKLGEWVAQVRCRGLAKPHYIKALDAIGFEWVGKKKRLQKAKETMNTIDLKNKIRKGKMMVRQSLKQKEKV